MSGSAGNDLQLERADAVDAPAQRVADLDRRDAFGRAAEDQVAGRQRPGLRDVLDDLGHAPDQLAQRAGLARLAVHIERDHAVGGQAAVFGTTDRPDRRRFVEALAYAPGPAERLRVGLHV